MELTSHLPWKTERILQKLLGNVSLSLLYKSQVHGNNSTSLLDKCCCQGPTITMIYFPFFTLGAFLFGSYPEKLQVLSEPNHSYIFIIQGEEIISKKYLITALEVTNESLIFYCSKDRVLFVELRKDKSATCTLQRPLLEKLGMAYFYSRDYHVEYEVFRVEGTKDKEAYINKIMRVKDFRCSLLEELRKYKFCDNRVSEIRILLLGPVGSGKSSFFNSVKSIFQGHVTRQAAVGSDTTSITEQYRVYSIRDEKDGKSLPFRLCDSMGLEDKEGGGLCVDDIPYIIKGNISDRYQFTPHKPITSNHPAFITSPSLKDKTHCVVYVLDVNSVDSLSLNMVSAFKRIQREALNHGVALVVLLTHVKNYADILQDNYLNMNKSMSSQNQLVLKKVHALLNIPIFNIFMIENYASELDLNPLKDTVILSALRQMLRAANDVLEDLSLEDTD